MDLDFTPEQQAFRADIRAWVAANLPQDIALKVHNGLRLHRDDMQRWARILGARGWLGYGWPKEFGGPGWDAIERHLFEEECALAGAPRILLLDEATSHIDSQTEQIVQTALDELRGTVTVIAIAHRLSTIRDADRIIVLNHGRIAETGPHEQLMQINGGLYQRLYLLQQLAA